MLRKGFGKAVTLAGTLALLATLVAPGNARALTCAETRELTMLYFKLHFAFNSFDDELSRRTLDTFVEFDAARVQAFIDHFERLFNPEGF